jgi:hypothetical protein
VVKIDVEGAELLVLEGAKETIRKAKPILAFEHVWSEEGSPRVYELLSGLGMRVFDMDGSGPLSRNEFFDVLQQGNRWNWIAHD